MDESVRKHVRLSQRLAAVLEGLARERGVSQSEVVRQALDHEFERSVAWEEAKAFMLSLRDSQDKRAEPYRWNREDAYEERLRRYEQGGSQ